MSCGHEWMAPLAEPTMIRYPDGRQVLATHIPQTCCLVYGHAGPHRSLHNVTTPRPSAITNDQVVYP